MAETICALPEGGRTARLLLHAQRSMLLDRIGVGVKDGLEDVGDELLHLLGSAAHKVFGHQTGHDLLFGQAKGRVCGDAVSLAMKGSSAIRRLRMTLG